MFKEIGSEFWDIPIDGKNQLFPDNTQWFISGRSALKAIIKENKWKSVALPVWCCDSMIRPFASAGLKIYFYPALQPICNIKTDSILVMDYFGYTGHSNLVEFAGVIIRDLTHSLLSKTYNDAEYYFGSLRKWAGFYTGGFAWGFRKEITFDKVNFDYVELRKSAMSEKSNYINANNSSDNDEFSQKDFLRKLKIAEDLLDEIGIHPALNRDIDLAKKFNVEFVMQQRRKNAAVLLNAFSDLAIFPELKDTDCPLFVPIRLKARDELRSFLIQHNIYCPIHWLRSEYHKLNNEAERFYAEELSLVCDQRYDENDMDYIVKIVKKFLETERKPIVNYIQP